MTLNSPDTPRNQPGWYHKFQDLWYVPSLQEAYDLLIRIRILKEQNINLEVDKVLLLNVHPVVRNEVEYKWNWVRSSGYPDYNFPCNYKTADYEEQYGKHKIQRKETLELKNDYDPILDANPETLGKFYTIGGKRPKILAPPVPVGDSGILNPVNQPDPPADKGQNPDPNPKPVVPPTGDDGKVQANLAPNCPIYKPHSNRKFPAVTYHLPVSYSHTDKSVKTISAHHPCKLEELHSLSRDNEHPVCAAYRSMCEAWALNQLIEELKPEETKDTFILDVGGSARRHYTNGRKYVWSCIPKFDARDMLRSFKLPGKLHCDHSWQQCACKSYSASISVHSLYYIPPGDMLSNMLKQVRPVHYAVVHFYPGEKGVLMNDEMEYVKKDGQIWVRARGNLTYYNHGDCDWMQTGHYTDSNGTLEWEIARRFGDSYVLRFVASPTVYSAPPLPPSKSEESKVAKPEEAKIEPYVVDPVKFESIVNQCLDYSAEINSANLKKFLQNVTRRGKSENLDIKKLVQYAQYKYQNQGAVIKPPSHSLLDASMERAYALKLILEELNLAHVALVAFALLFGFFVIMRGPMSIVDLFWFCVELVKHWKLSIWVVGGLSASIYVYVNWFSVRAYFQQQRLPFTHTSLLYHTRARVDDYCCSMPGRPLDKTKCILLKEPEESKFDCEVKPAAYAMVYHPDFAPYFPRKCAHNSVSAVADKLLYVIPNAGKYSYPLHPILEQVAKMIKNNLTPLSFEEWVSRFPNAKQLRLRREYEGNLLNPIYNWNDSKSFVKFEAYNEPKYPRPIISSSVEFNYSTGSWLIGLVEMLAELLPHNICFPLHGDSADIGRFHDRYKHLNIADCDFSAFDSSQRDECLLLIASFMRLCGVPEKVIERELQDTTSITVRNRNGMKVIMKSIRCSGRSATLFGNTLVTLNTGLHVFGDNLAAIMVKGDDSVMYLKDSNVDPDDVIKTYLDNGLVAKFRLVDEYNVEFCSSIFLPTSTGSLLVSKPGKMIAKTFWCKNLEYSEEMIQQQFASILKGMRQSVECVPGLRGLLRNAVYQRWFPHVEAKREEYNEYTDESFVADDSTTNYLCIRYGLNPEDLDELEEELSYSFPIRLSTKASELMISKDWGASNEGAHLVENFTFDPERFALLVISPLLEEILRWCFPFWASLVIGGYESLHRRTILNLILHFFYECLSIWLHPIAALLVHYFVNCLAGPITNVILLTMPRAKKQSKRNMKPKQRVQLTMVPAPVKKQKNKNKNTTVPRPPPYAKLISDPCNADLVPGLYGTSTGVISRFKSTTQSASANTCGYILWVPTYPGYVTGTPSYNCIFYSPAASNQQIVNTGIDPFGASGATSGVAQAAGADAFLQGVIPEDFRTLSACMRCIYTGTTSNCKGRIAKVDNMSLSSFFTNKPSIDGLLSIAAETQRVGLDPMEITFRPSAEASHPKAVSTIALNGAVAPVTLSSSVLQDDPAIIGFVWSGITSSDLSFDFVQNIEWRPKLGNGFVELQAVQVSAGTSFVDKALSWLDRYAPGWTTTLMDGASHGLTSMVGRVLAGPSQRLLTGGSNRTPRLSIMN